MPNAPASPCSAINPASKPTRGWEWVRTYANTVVTAVCAKSALMNILRRSNRSARTPPIGDPRPCVAKAATPTKPVEEAFPVKRATRTPTVIACNQVPVSETTLAVHMVANARWRRTVRGLLDTGRAG